jgi:hypothetical protein
MKKAILSVTLIFWVGCGTEAPFDAQILGPSDQEVTVYSAGGFTYAYTGPLLFTVLNADGNKPLPGIDIEFYTDGRFIDSNGAPVGTLLGTGDNYLKRKTDDAGVASVFVYYTFPVCDLDDDITYTTTVRVVTSADIATWTGSVTVPQC